MIMIMVMIVANRYLYLNREDYQTMKARGAVACEEIIDEPSGETRFKIIVRVYVVLLRSPKKNTLPPRGRGFDVNLQG